MSSLEGPTTRTNDMRTHSALATIFSGSQMSSSPFSMPATITPRGRSALAYPHASRLNLRAYVPLQPQHTMDSQPPAGVAPRTVKSS